jgi:hypothetical protein
LWLLKNRWVRKLGWIFSVLIVLAVLITLWDWIGRNAALLTAIGAWVTGLALAFFAWRTYKLSRWMVELQYASKVELHAVRKPEQGRLKKDRRLTIMVWHGKFA